jgi:hypothetical protein
VVAWRLKDYARAANLLAPARKELWKIGGSHAQRDLFVLMLIDSAARSGDKALAGALLAERAVLRPGNPVPDRMRQALA